MGTEIAPDDRKSAALAARNFVPPEGARVISSFGLVRDVLRSPAVCQGGLGVERKAVGDPRFASVFFLDGDQHKRRRQEIARFFTPKAISTTYHQVMADTSDRLLSRFRADGRATLDELSFELTVAVAAEIVGLTASSPAAMAKRIQAVLLSTRTHHMHPWLRPLANALASAHGIRFFVRDVRPAIKARQRQRRADVISHLIDEGYPAKSILIECMTYAVAGMVTTREFIVMAAWHMFDDEALRLRFVDGDTGEQSAILDELLRLEPVAAMLRRRANSDAEFASGSIVEGDLLALSIRDANVDEATVGPCPYSLDPDRAKHNRVVGAYLSFGEGSHRCPGAQVAMNESRVFLDRLMRVPGLKLAEPPRMSWNGGIGSYELRGAMITCDRA